MGAVAGLQLAIRHPEKVDQLIFASGAYDVEGWQPEFIAFIPQMTVEMFVSMPFAEDYKKLAANPDGFPALVEKLIALEKEPMAWEADVKALKTPVLIITGDADVATLEHSVAMFRLLGGGVMGDMGKPLSASRLAVLPATSHTAVISQPDLLDGVHRAVPQGRDAQGLLRVGGGAFPAGDGRPGRRSDAPQGVAWISRSSLARGRWAGGRLLSISGVERRPAAGSAGGRRSAGGSRPMKM